LQSGYSIVAGGVAGKCRWVPAKLTL